jgi:hypothetical protein
VALAAGAAGAVALPILSEVRIRRAAQPISDEWRRLPVEPRGATPLGISFRPLQVEAMGLDAAATLRNLLGYSFQLIRLGAYWNRIEPERGAFRTDELDGQVEAAEQAGKQVVLCVGALKTFGYPEFFAPAHHLPDPLPEGALVDLAGHGGLLDAATTFITRVVKRYRDRKSIVAWQVEHEAVDPLGVEHSWRLAAAFVGSEVAAVRAADPTRPIMMNGFLPTSTPVRLQQWWRTRDQGDSLVVAQQLADIVGIDYYPRHAVLDLGGLTLYLDGAGMPWQGSRRKRLFAWARMSGLRVMISEGQAEPWESVTTPPNPPGQAMYSCTAAQMIRNYNQWMRWARQGSFPLDAYVFWGAEYWVMRNQSGDSSYIQAFARILEEG